ncbi:MAG: bifunctional folylpolyglutamate synthase/dihydrofolate synthase [Bacillota bacterium]
MNYDEALEYIHGTLKFGSKLGLHNIGVLLGLMGEPHKKLKYVHVAGTNGKGSTSAFISSILTEAGYRTGLFTSPFIQRFTERIRIGNEEISPAELAEITAFVKSCVDRMLAMGESHPTEFEIVTAIGFEYFYRKKCDIVVLEVGLGGRFDSTNIIDTPEVAVIATINYDHTDRLGGTLPEIAFEKAGIIKPGGNVVIYGQDKEVEKVFENACAERGAKLTRTDFSGIVIHDFGIDGQTFSFEQYDRLKIRLLGRHQTRNAALAVKAVETLREKGFNISDEALGKGLEKARWPGRLEVLSKDPVVLIDGAHNAEGAAVLKNAIDEYFPGRPVTFIMGVLKDKPYLEMIKTVLPGCKRVFTVTARSPKALPADILAKAAADYCKNVQISDTIESAVRISMETAETDEVICAFGSLYYIGIVREMFGQ